MADGLGEGGEGAVGAPTLPIDIGAGTGVGPGLGDANGLAKAWWNVGADAGRANNRVSVTSKDIAGTIGFCASADPARVFKGIRGPGQMGNKRATQRGLEVVDVRADENLLFVRGSVPGPKGSVVEIRSEG